MAVMARRSLQASALGIEKAKKAFKRLECTQEYLASQVGLETRQSIWKFFTGKPIARHIFMEICFQLGLDWQEIIEQPSEIAGSEIRQDCNEHQDIDGLVQLVRSRRREKIQDQCSTIRLLDVAQPVRLEDIYVDVNISHSSKRQIWLDVSELPTYDSGEINCLEQVNCKRVSAMQLAANYSKLVVLGKLGSGKTTFLKYLATQCNQGRFLPNHVPFFLQLRNFVEDARKIGDFSLLNYLTQEHNCFGIKSEQIKNILYHGRALILLDGLDEVQDEDSTEVIKQIGKLADDYYKNSLIVTCRIATQQHQFEGFTEIEIADFDSLQIEDFAQKWFLMQSKSKIPAWQFKEPAIASSNFREKGQSLATQFIHKLQMWENRQIRELAVTPLLLNLACSVFQARLDFPSRRAELYKQGLDILLNRWDKARNIRRSEIDSQLSLHHKLKLLSQIAAITFEQGNYFFTQSNVQHYIRDYLRSLSTTEPDPEVLQLNSEAVLKLLEAQGLLVKQSHLIYSFSFRAFHEYLTARNIVESPNPQILKEKLLSLVSHLTEPRWRKIFVLTASMLGHTTELLQLLKQRIDALVASDEHLQQLLVWLRDKSVSVQASCKPVAIRAFYLTQLLSCNLKLTNVLSFSQDIDSSFANHLCINRALSLDLAKAYDELALEQGYSWQLNKQQQEVLEQYYMGNHLLVTCLKSSFEIPAAVREEIEATLLLPVSKKALHTGSMKCPKCNSTEISRNGHRRGRQAYICKNCHRQFLDSYLTQGYSNEVKQICLKMYVNGMSFRAIERVMNVSHNSVIKWAKVANEISSDIFDD